MTGIFGQFSKHLRRMPEYLAKHDDEFLRYCVEREQVETKLERDLHKTDDPEEIMNTTLKAVCDFYGGDWAGLMDIDTDTRIWRPLHWTYTSSEACWTPLNVRDILKRREYTGVMVMNNRLWKGLDNPRTVLIDESEWKIIPNCHEAIVSEAEFEDAQKVFRKIRKYGKTQNEYLLRSLIYCGNCGRSMQRQKHNPAVYYNCSKSAANRETSCPVGEKFYEKDLERVVQNDLLEKLRLLVEADERLRETAASTKGTEENLRFRLEQIEKRLKQISLSRTGAYERYADGSLSRELYLAERDRLYAEADTLAAEKDKLEKALVSLVRSKNQDMTDAVQKAHEVLSAGELTNEMLLFFIERVNVYTGMRVEIIYRFSDEIAEAVSEAENG